ncbi:hypothetical protein HY450_01575 [Candidatus Pacearchaeota archaeon]|nr:hypothetical protein [Candidatus Pacearchaeota archaeon]
MFPSKEREAFRQEFGFPIRGWESDIVGEDKRGFSNFVQVVHKERMEKPFDITSLTIEPKEFYKKSGFQQILQTFSSGYSGNYFLDKIGVVGKIEPLTSTATLHHECKHAKTSEILREHPEFRERWEELAKDKNGKSLYYTNFEYVCSRFAGLDTLVEAKKKNNEEDDKEGFVSNYARTSFAEDVAELGEEAEVNPWRFYHWLFGDSANPTIKGKVELAQEFGIIPREFSEFVRLQRIMSQDINYGPETYTVNANKAKKFMEESEVFLSKNVKSIYEGEVRVDRGYIMMKCLGENHYTNEEVAEEYKKVLTSEFKSFEYANALSNLAEVYSYQREEEKAKIYYEARAEYFKRFYAGDVALARVGVNDFLESRGEKFD